MRNDPEWAMRYIWYKRTGQPPIPFDDFRPSEVPAFLVGIDRLFEDPQLSYNKRWGPPRRLALPNEWTEAVVTGDPLIDKWEREIAQGRTPNLTEGAQ